VVVTNATGLTVWFGGQANPIECEWITQVKDLVRTIDFNWVPRRPFERSSDQKNRRYIQTGNGDSRPPTEGQLGHMVL